MKHSRVLPVLLVALPLHAAPIVIEAGDLQTLINGTVIPAADSGDKYQLPTEAQKTPFALR